MKVRENTIFQSVKNPSLMISLLLVICSAIIGVFSGFGLGSYLLLLLLFFVFVIFAFKNYTYFLVLLLFISTNIGLISQNVAIKMASGKNLVELRDLLIIIAIVIGLIKGRKYFASVLKNPLIWSGCLICVAGFIGALVGFLNGGDTITILKEFYTLECWILPLIVAANINTKKDLQIIFYSLMIFGVVIVTGANIEALTHNKLHLVSSYAAPSIGAYYTTQNLSRSVPEGNALIAFTALLLLVFIITTKKNPISNKTRTFFVIVLIYILLSSFFIQLRTSVAVFCLGALIFSLSYGKIERVTVKKVILWVFLLAILVGSIIALFKVLTDYVGSNVVKASLQRFENLIKNIDSDGRVIEYPFAYFDFISHPFFGIGLGLDYRPIKLILAYGKPSATIHNIANFFLIKMGVFGLIPFIFFILAVIRSFRTNLQLHRMGQNILGICLALGLVGILIQSFVGNVFCLIQSAPPALLIVGLLAANEKIVENSFSMAQHKPAEMVAEN